MDSQLFKNWDWGQLRPFTQITILKLLQDLGVTRLQAFETIAGDSKHLGTACPIFQINTRDLHTSSRAVTDIISYFQSVESNGNHLKMVACDFNGVIGYRVANKSKATHNWRFVARPNLKVLLDGLSSLNYSGISTFAYTSARIGNVEQQLANVFRPYRHLQNKIVFDQFFCFIRIAKGVPKDRYGQALDMLNTLLYRLHDELQLAIKLGFEDKTLDYIETISVILQLFMMKAYKDLQNLKQFVTACNPRLNLDIVLLDDQVAEKLPDGQRIWGVEIQSYKAETRAHFNPTVDSPAIVVALDAAVSRLLGKSRLEAILNHIRETSAYVRIVREKAKLGPNLMAPF